MVFCHVLGHFSVRMRRNGSIYTSGLKFVVTLVLRNVGFPIKELKFTIQAIAYNNNAVFKTQPIQFIIYTSQQQKLDQPKFSQTSASISVIFVLPFLARIQRSHSAIDTIALDFRPTFAFWNDGAQIYCKGIVSKNGANLRFFRSLYILEHLRIQARTSNHIAINRSTYLRQRYSCQC